jgi:bifunctional N-acetylglucosamine-1-phosphate-uridyltransferase/glucosamine-1-phosphate-acetyltransferase GlmU-like protein
LIGHFIAHIGTSPFADYAGPPWGMTAEAERLVRFAMSALGDGYRIDGERAVHHTARVEPGAVLKGPMILGPTSFVAEGAYLRGGIFLDEGCIVGPGCEVKSSFLFMKSKIAHLSFVGDSLIGASANIEAGAVIANYRNEMIDKDIRIVWRGEQIETGTDKFGALVGDGVRIGANAVIAPGALLEPGTIVGRLALVDQHPQASA